MGLLLLLGVVALLLKPSNGSSSHSLRYFYTVVSEASQELPQYIAVGYVDDQPITYYDSNLRREQPRVPWMQKVGDEYWDTETSIGRDNEIFFRESLTTARNRYNQTGGFHTLQRKYGCALKENKSGEGYLQYAYDGRDFLSFDKETLTWTAIDGVAQRTKRKWEADLEQNIYDKAYLEETCIEWLRKYLDYGKETLLRTERPVVKVTSQAEHDGMETLVCQAHGFYPKAIETTWRKDGEVMDHATFRRDVAPNSDGTYHAWLSIKVDPKDRDRYRCHVGHDSLLEPLDFAWEETDASNLGLIVGCVVGATVALLVAGIVGIYFYKKRQDGYKAASTKDQNSDSSGSNPAI
ncbi:H-2 class I histocompatibility antigen, Q9 alpha chain-like [Elgaria multicarinata webbii]|uniref:H-2 class I histocompatibility antigen, Q9 alpha chain-like n=1 Tax=Elgaria multicarinata webbii TaxID=159646 RepID=UPI002FCD65F2